MQRMIDLSIFLMTDSVKAVICLTIIMNKSYQIVGFNEKHIYICRRNDEINSIL